MISGRWNGQLLKETRVDKFHRRCRRRWGRANLGAMERMELLRRVWGIVVLDRLVSVCARLDILLVFIVRVRVRVNISVCVLGILGHWDLRLAAIALPRGDRASKCHCIGEDKVMARFLAEQPPHPSSAPPGPTPSNSTQLSSRVGDARVVVPMEG